MITSTSEAYDFSKWDFSLRYRDKFSGLIKILPTSYVTAFADCAFVYRRAQRTPKKINSSKFPREKLTNIQWHWLSLLFGSF